MNIILTGATGFIGKATAEELNKNDSFSVIPLSSKDIDITDALATEEKITSICMSAKTDCVFHAAGTANLSGSFGNPEKHMRINKEGTRNILDAAIKNNIPWIIYTSSASVYGTDGILSEDTKKTPKSPYGQSKLKAEEEIIKAHAEYGIDYTILRYFNVYGRGETPGNNHMIPNITRSITKGETFRLTSTGEQSRDFIYISDVAKINSMIIEKNIRNHTINIGTGTVTTINRIISEAEKNISKKAHIEYISKDSPPDMAIADISKLKKFIGNYNFIGIKEGMKEYTTWFLKNSGDI